MSEYQTIYALFNFVNGTPYWIHILNTFLSLTLGAWIVYRFNIKIEQRKQKENRRNEFKIKKAMTSRTLEEYRLLGSFISEYKSKGEFQIAVREATDDFNENLYYIRLSNFDSFRIKFAELRSSLLQELNDLNRLVEPNPLLIALIEKIERYNIPSSLDFNSKNIKNGKGEIILESEVDKMVQAKLSNFDELISLVDQVKKILPVLIFKE